MCVVVVDCVTGDDVFVGQGRTEHCFDFTHPGLCRRRRVGGQVTHTTRFEVVALHMRSTIFKHFYVQEATQNMILF